MVRRGPAESQFGSRPNLNSARASLFYHTITGGMNAEPGWDFTGITDFQSSIFLCRGNGRRGTFEKILQSGNSARGLPPGHAVRPLNNVDQFAANLRPHIHVSAPTGGSRIRHDRRAEGIGSPPGPASQSRTHGLSADVAPSHSNIFAKGRIRGIRWRMYISSGVRYGRTGRFQIRSVSLSELRGCRRA